MTQRAERATRRKAQRRPKGQSVTFTVQGEKIELVQGSMKRLQIEHGDLLVLRLAHDPDRDEHKAILARVSELLRETGRRATAVVMPVDFDFELIPHETAVELLTELTEKKENENVDDG